MSHRVVDLIIRKRSGKSLARDEIEDLIGAYCRREIPDYQMSSLLMAVYFQGMSEAETVDLTRAMLESGSRLDLGSADGPKIDKHSTGGVGDKVSIILGPLVAACGVRVPMISGRGLAHTGGTLDKLESIPGFRVAFTEKQFLSNLKRVGLVIAGQSARWVPADKRLYALRDVTGTVESVPLIVGSILSKKLASGIGGLVLDVKVGSGGFNQTSGRAKDLAGALLRTADHWKLPTAAVLTRMDEPLGRAVGNAPEIVECVQALHGDWEPDLRTVTMDLAAEMLVLGNVASSRRVAIRILEDALGSGRALEKFRAFVAAQGGDPAVVDDPGMLPTAKARWAVRSPRAGYVTRLDALRIGQAAGRLGAGRAKVTDTVQFAVGLWLRKKVGERVAKGETLADLLASSRADAQATAGIVLSAYEIGRARTRPQRIILGRMYNNHASKLTS
ncbi:MAG: thymidine phosphorylase [Candidatus Eisenbacteria sp.]|nr:thymidine phosphorylase [Candidatus Eisenbacteria bacterium]